MSNQTLVCMSDLGLTLESTMRVVDCDELGSTFNGQSGEGFSVRQSAVSFAYYPHQPLFSPSTMATISELSIKTEQIELNRVMIDDSLGFINYDELYHDRRFLSGFKGKLEEWVRMLHVNSKSEAWNALTNFFVVSLKQAEDLTNIIIDFNKLHQVWYVYGQQFAQANVYLWVRRVYQTLELARRSLTITGVLSELTNKIENPGVFVTMYTEGVDLVSNKARTSFWKLNDIRYCLWSTKSVPLGNYLPYLNDHCATKYGDMLPLIPLEHAIMTTGMYHIHYYRNIPVLHNSQRSSFPNGINSVVYHLMEWLVTKDRAMHNESFFSSANLFDIPSFATMLWYEANDSFSMNNEYYQPFQSGSHQVSVTKQIDLLVHVMWYVALSKTWPLTLGVTGKNDGWFYHPDRVMSVAYKLARQNRLFFSQKLGVDRIVMPIRIFEEYLCDHISMQTLPKMPLDLKLSRPFDFVRFLCAVVDPVDYLLLLVSFQLSDESSPNPALQKRNIVVLFYALITYFKIPIELIEWLFLRFPDDNSSFYFKINSVNGDVFVNFYLMRGDDPVYPRMLMSDVQQRLIVNSGYGQFGGVLPQLEKIYDLTDHLKHCKLDANDVIKA